MQTNSAIQTAEHDTPRRTYIVTGTPVGCEGGLTGATGQVQRCHPLMPALIEFIVMRAEARHREEQFLSDHPGLGEMIRDVAGLLPDC